MKRRFEFRLERLRRVRALEEQVARAERAQAESVARAAEARRDEARSVLERSRAHLRALLAGRLAPRGVLSSQRALDSELEHLRRRLESARTQRTQAERLTAVHRERQSATRALEELRERAREQHRTALEKHENAVLDEVAQRLRVGGRRSAARKEESPSSSEASHADQGPGSAPDRAS